MVTTLIAQIVRFARPNIQIYDARIVDLYQWVCAQYLVGVKGAETKAKRSLARLSTEFQSGSRWLSKPYPAQKKSGDQPSKTRIYIIFQEDMAEREGFEPTVRFPAHTLSKRAP